ncbi:MAG: YihY/virulence factor BrkB family protein [Deltaproteobacteria bacterium]|nr:YihY/virulence factor BrkB family protein [Deltaproteobacteria bacterium]
MRNPIDWVVDVYDRLDRSGVTNWPLLAAALSFYTSLAVVPVLAICFAVAKSMGLEEALNRALMENFSGQEAILNTLTRFAENLISNFSGSLLVFTALAVIFWSVYGLLWQLEMNFSKIFGYLSDRQPLHRAADYLTIMLVIPIFLIAAGSSNIFIESLAFSNNKIAVALRFKPLTSVLIKVFPVIIWWTVLAWTYSYFSRGIVGWRERLMGGLITGLVFQLFQKFYLKTIIYITSYNAVYGSFAIVPFFMVWLYISWIIVIFGGEFTRRLTDYFLTRTPVLSILTPLSIGALKDLSVRIMELILSAYKESGGVRRMGLVALAYELKTPTPYVGKALNCLQKCGVLTRIASSECETGPTFFPSVDPELLSRDYVTQSLEKLDQI